MTVIGNPLWVQAISYAAADDRTLLRFLASAPGVSSLSDLGVTQNGTPNMSVNVAAGQALVQRSSSSPTDYYITENTGTVNLAIAASDPTNPRIDLIVVRVYDAQYSGALNQATVEVVTGTPAASPVVPTAPVNSLSIATVGVTANATTIVNANIADKRVNWGRVLGPVTPLVYTSTGTVTATQAAGAVAIKIRCQNAGGGSGGIAATSASSAASGSGAGGAYAEKTVATAGLTFPLAVTVGPAGVAGTSGANPGGAGGTSKVVDNNGSGSTLCSPGTQTSNQAGGGGASSTSITGAAGIAGFDPSTSGGVGDIIIWGQPGANAPRVFATIALGTAGGNSHLGAGGAATSVSGAGTAGQNYGGGAAGVVGNGTTGAIGGVAGGPGIVLVELIY